MVRILLAAALVLGPPGCTDDAPAAPTRKTHTVTTTRSDGGQLDGLTLTLKLETTVLPPPDGRGGGVASTLVLENRTDASITDPGCWISAYRYDVIPMDQPNAKLQGAVIVDCEGSFTYTPGYRDAISGPTFDADPFTTDEPLAPGDYLAAVDIRGFSERLSVPVVVRD